MIIAAALALGTASVAGAAAKPRPLKQKCGVFTPTAGMHPLWLRASDGVRLYAAEVGTAKTAIVLAHQSPADLCGWMYYVPHLAKAGFRVLSFDFRGYGDSAPGVGTAADAYERDLRAAIAHLRSEGAKRVILMGASFGGAAALADGWRLHVDGVVSLSGEPELPVAGFDGLAGVRKLRAPLLLVASSGDRYCNAADTHRLLRAAGSHDKHATIYPGVWHGWSIVEDAPYQAKARATILAWIRRIANP
ncbi:MAG TPA: alpha/beta fold hydrolase [Gaiellaceae bacterium]